MLGNGSITKSALQFRFGTNQGVFRRKLLPDVRDDPRILFLDAWSFDGYIGSLSLSFSQTTAPPVVKTGHTRPACNQPRTTDEAADSR